MEDYAVIAKQEKLIAALRREVNYLKGVSNPTEIETQNFVTINVVLLLSENLQKRFILLYIRKFRGLTESRIVGILIIGT